MKKLTHVLTSWAKALSAFICVLLLFSCVSLHAAGPGINQVNFQSSEIGEVFFTFPINNTGEIVTLADFQHGELFILGKGKDSWWNLLNPRSPVLSGEIVMGSDKPHNIGFWGDLATWKNNSALSRILDYNQRTQVGVKRLPISSMWDTLQAPYIFTGGHGYTSQASLLHVSDVSDPSDIKIIATIDAGALLGFKIGPTHAVGNLLICSGAQTAGVAVFDISDPTNPILLSSVIAGGSAYTSLIYGNRLYNCETHNGIVRVYDFSDPNNISEVGVLDIGGLPRYIIFKDGEGHVTAANSNYYIFDSDTLAIQHTYEGAGLNKEFVVPIGNMALVAGGNTTNGARLIAIEETPDRRGPDVVYANPVANATDLALTTRIGMSMSDQIDVRFLSKANFIVRPIGGLALDGDYSTQMGVINFSPAVPLEADTTYEVILVNGGVKDIVGNGIEATYSYTFSTREALHPPTVQEILSNRDPAPLNTVINFKAFASDLNGDSLSYIWNFGDGTPSTNASQSSSVNHQFTKAGRFSVIVTVSDGIFSTTGVIVQRIHYPLTPQRPAYSNKIIYHDRSGNDRVWNVNPDNNTVSCINAFNNELICETAVGQNPKSLTLAPDNTVWVACSESDEIKILDANNGNVISSLPLNHGDQPMGIVTAPNGSAIYVTLMGSRKLLKFSPDTRTKIDEVQLDLSPRAVAVTGDSTKVMVASFISPDQRGVLWDINATTLNIRGIVPLRRDTTTVASSSGAPGLPNYLEPIPPAGKWMVSGSAVKKVGRKEIKNLDSP